MSMRRVTRGRQRILTASYEKEGSDALLDQTYASPGCRRASCSEPRLRSAALAKMPQKCDQLGDQ